MRLFWSNWSHLNCLLEVYLDFYFFLWPQIKVQICKAKIARTFLYFSYTSNFLFMIYPGWDLAMLRAKLIYDLNRRSLGKVKQNFKGRFICIKNNLMDIAPFPQGYFNHFLLQLLFQNYMTSGTKLSMH